MAAPTQIMFVVAFCFAIIAIVGFISFDYYCKNFYVFTFTFY